MAKRRRRRHRVVHHRRFRRNPIGGTGFLGETLMPAAIGAGGAIAVDWLSNQLPLPASMNTPTMAPVVKVGLALLVGYGVSMVAGSRAGGEAAAGGVIVALYNFANQQLLQGGMGYGYGGYMGRYMNGMGFIRRANLPAINARRAMHGLAPIGVGPGTGRPIGLSPLNQKPGLGANPYGQTKFRMMRNGSASGRGQLGYLGPAPTLGRYMNNGR